MESNDGWDIEASAKQFLKFNGNEFTRVDEEGTEAAVTKKRFTTGEENALFVFEVTAKQNLTSVGIMKEGRYK